MSIDLATETVKQSYSQLENPKKGPEVRKEAEVLQGCQLPDCFEAFCQPSVKILPNDLKICQIWDACRKLTTLGLFSFGMQLPIEGQWIHYIVFIRSGVNNGSKR